MKTPKDIYTKEELAKLKTLGASTLLDLLLHLPSSYENNELLSTYTRDMEGALCVSIEDSVGYKGYSKKLMRVRARIVELVDRTNLVESKMDRTTTAAQTTKGVESKMDSIATAAQTTKGVESKMDRTPKVPLPDITITIFHPKPYHRAIFKPHARLIISGHFIDYEVVQPRVIKSASGIAPLYKVKGLRPSTLMALVKKIKKEDLSPLPPSYIDAILGLHSASPSLLAELHEAKSASLRRGIVYSPKVLEALKYLEFYNHVEKLGRKKLSFAAHFRASQSSDAFIKRLPFTLTPCQSRVIKEIEADMSKGAATRRLIIGDVGCGKTLIMLASVYMMYPKKSIIMAPTTILATQLYNEARKYLGHLNIRLVIQGEDTLKKPAKANKAGKIAKATTKTAKTARADKAPPLPTLAPLDDSAIDLYIGTTALLYRDLARVDDLGLIITDEQHRFGTSERDLLLKSFAKDGAMPHMLQFSATPIPRTLALMQSSMIDVSLITSMPYEKDIKTLIYGTRDFAKILALLDSELDKGNAAAIIYPLVNKSEHLNYASLSEGAAFWQARYSGVYVTSGQDRDKERVLEAFASDSESRLLLSTTMIEVGISLPRLSTIVIVGAERLGLATLHQLRGRVSRNGLRGFCVLFTKAPIGERLREFASTKEGFSIAKLDLKYRSSGDLLSGTRQSGANFAFFDMSSDEEIARDVAKKLGLRDDLG